ncbi:MAG TPA: hypothetical protein DIT04_09370 [Dysgonomonas sp.]|nr:hypothetical protein [Dysgonomonas sp.]
MKFKNLFFIVLLFSSFISCKSQKAKSDSVLRNLTNQISVETGCPVNRIVLESQYRSDDGKMNETYAFDVCGKRMVYKRIGSVYLNSDDMGKLFNR